MVRLSLGNSRSRLLHGILILVLLFSAVSSVLAFRFYTFLHTPLSIPESGFVLALPSGMSAKQVSQILSRERVLKFPTGFLIFVCWKGAWNQLKAGEYLLKPGATVVDVVRQLQEGRVIQHAFTIVPGWNFARLMAELNQLTVVSHKLNGLGELDIMAALGYPGQHPEGQFFPETYYFPAGTTDIAILQRAYRLLQKNLEIVWNNHQTGLPLKSSYEALILASIIEKESSEASEYGEIAGVYTRRLAKKMPLQADPTLIYGAGKAFIGVVDYDLLRRTTPYNTYQNIGLPPTPIALPSLKALEAAVHPKPGESLYFVAKGEGKGHVFSKTLQEHQTAVRAYRKAILGER